QARQLHDQAIAAQTAAQQAATKDAAYAQAVKIAQQHLATKNFAAAIQAGQEALKHRPSDPIASQLVQPATAGPATIAQAAAYSQAVQRAQTQLAAKNYSAAIQAAQDALRDRPNDPLATQIVQQATTALNTAKTAADVEVKKKASFNDAVQAGQRLIAQKKYA